MTLNSQLNFMKKWRLSVISQVYSKSKLSINDDERFFISFLYKMHVCVDRAPEEVITLKTRYIFLVPLVCVRSLKQTYSLSFYRFFYQYSFYNQQTYKSGRGAYTIACGGFEGDLNLANSSLQILMLLYFLRYHATQNLRIYLDTLSFGDTFILLPPVIPECLINKLETCRKEKKK